MAGPLPDVASLLTPVGRGAVAVVGVLGARGPSAVDRLFAASNGKPLSQQPLGRIVYGRFDGEEAVVCRLADDRVEVHCHGGRAAAARVLAHLAAQGCRIVDWREWTMADGQADALAKAASISLAAAPTPRTATILLDQAAGALSRAVRAAVRDLKQARTASADKGIAELLTLQSVGVHLTAPWRVVLAGRPNVGKSSLINTLVGYERAIVYDQPGTTRDVVTAAGAVDGWPVQLVDVAGLRRGANEIEGAGIELARRQMAAADLVLWVIEAPLAVGRSATEAAAEEARAWLVDGERPAITVVNKIDLTPDALWADEPATVAVSARSGAGVVQLVDKIARQLVPHPPQPGVAVPFTRELVASLERIRALIPKDPARAATELESLLAG